MKRIRFDSIILFSLVTYFIMNYRLGSHDTPYGLFGLIFLLLLTYILVDLLKMNKKNFQLVKTLLLASIILIVLGSAFLSAIIVRHRVAPVYKIHDIILQQEAAIRYLIQRKNPYAENYFGTFLEEWHYSDSDINPALYHFVMEPFYLLFAVPFYFFANQFIGYFDGRMPLFLLFFLILPLLYRLPEKNINKRLFVILFAFNPATLPYLLEGRSDIFMYAFFLYGLYFLHKRKWVLSGMFLAFSFAVKQSIWPFFPFYIVYLWFNNDEKIFRKKIYAMMPSLLSFIITFTVIVFPFFIWDMHAFLNSTIFYLTGSIETSYPISGYGVGMLLYQLGVIKDRFSYYPFILLQVVFCIPVFIFLLKYIKRNPTVHKSIISYGIFLFVYWYFSRYFNNSHVGYLSTIFITAYFWPPSSSIRAKAV